MSNVGPLYETTISSVQARDSPITYEALEALLLSVERRVSEYALPAADEGSHALHADRSCGRGRNSLISGRGGSNRGGSHSHGNLSSGITSSGSAHPRGRGTFSHSHGSSSRGSSILGPAPGTPTSNGNSFFNTGRIQCQICSRTGHSAIDCFNRLNLSYEGRVPSSRLTAMTAHHSPSSETWLTDTGANSHVTPNLDGEDALPREE
ncbi:uncharacterized protein LOC133740446 isoform X2 [Rosa rugosa]|uniref:uncharacterized protein LOC133740446 isoform X2 n=1 Tax=Rosa rugosa TaxID=74645 RepID=UPI002B411055|nr:uncharacterized protein LOC133740446 isoform X2 [Rosa rugosa]